MTKRVIALSGVSGAGKTYRRTTDPALKDLPCVDIADIYAEFPGAPKAEIFAAAMFRLQDLICEHDAVVFEAALLPGSRQRPILESCLRNCGAELEYLVVPTPPRAVLLGRILNDYHQAIEEATTDADRAKAENYFNARQNFIMSVVQP